MRLCGVVLFFARRQCKWQIQLPIGSGFMVTFYAPSHEIFCKPSANANSKARASLPAAAHNIINDNIAVKRRFYL
jgi:hypothetical protein